MELGCQALRTQHRTQLPKVVKHWEQNSDDKNSTKGLPRDTASKALNTQHSLVLNVPRPRHTTRMARLTTTGKVPKIVMLAKRHPRANAFALQFSKLLMTTSGNKM